MKGDRKPFSGNDFRANDARARNAMITYLMNKGYAVRDNPDRYGPDLEATKDGVLYYVEVEIKSCYKGGRDGDFPYPTIQLPERKSKYRKYPNISFWILSTDIEWAVCIPGKALKYLRPVEVPNCRMWRNEFFYQVPMERCIITYIGDKQWKE